MRVTLAVCTFSIFYESLSISLSTIPHITSIRLHFKTVSTFNSDLSRSKWSKSFLTCATNFYWWLIMSKNRGNVCVLPISFNCQGLKWILKGLKPTLRKGTTIRKFAFLMVLDLERIIVCSFEKVRKFIPDLWVPHRIESLIFMY